MKKIYLLFICFIVVAQTISAQNDKKLLKMTFGESYFELKYDAKGKLVETVEYYADESTKRNSKYTYNDNKVEQIFYENDNVNDKDNRTSVLKQK